MSDGGSRPDGAKGQASVLQNHTSGRSSAGPSWVGRYSYPFMGRSLGSRTERSRIASALRGRGHVHIADGLPTGACIEGSLLVWAPRPRSVPEVSVADRSVLQVVHQASTESWLRESDLGPKPPGPDITAVNASDIGFAVRIHDLRHAHASWLLAGGSDLKSMMERMGHTQIQTTQKYLHALPDADQKNLDALDRMTHGDR
jgi:hypothetical protein